MVNTTWSISTNGVSLDTKTGDRPAATPTELIVTRAVEAKDGWLGQIVMSGQIVHETDPQTDDDEGKGSAKALALVNQHVLDAFKRLIVGA